ncbi:MAG: hypothetical protein HKO65_14725, partial [Gemmatimonadetes bacterium]|nr:DUF192 domain-containing protein [Gemmatimonadota bacterium]NNM06343.1 hypothetical protein [Gemmatimonadota bacterium]
GILLVDCHSIHTFGRTFDVEVIFLDSKGKVLELTSGLRPWRKPRRVPRAVYVLEVPVGTIGKSGTEIGDELTWREPARYSISILSENRRSTTPPSTDAGGTSE